MVYNVLIIHIGPILHLCFPWDCKENKNFRMFLGGSVTEHWPSMGLYNAM